ncbi:putative Zn-dependent peptidase [Hydrogenoanaerobacterium saccharovorans]|uniref:Predicted Zn-dependent peptidase n=1 Tax=Hydrogenoanaerobacterium saccharovorans TaxID=474960 RepID=A0A1H7ZX66_9FIRM|nr:pitrilysin family protein [Hydrogenoanaerobacterium saccharovorans]RPF48314.1 putative Zn-dependent peptidase [Hydrogenoanaerobacterium saccharovorans]SEM63055.1 Predicted Zn-dependent peptidase [Hydrogenoanaerobacterium saccharovorans]
MNKTVISSDRLNERYVKIKHKSGLTMLLCPKPQFSSAYALFGAEIGSIDTTFKTGQDKDFVTVPAGIAHYLEHKLFESEDGDAFERYAKTGASANAFTSFDKTAYLFSCADNFKESIEILLDFVTHPYFTEETVRKEQGIIGQEIKMYDDNPDWRVLFNLLGALYVNNPVRVDIAGTVESIAEIDADLLYRCYNTFYNLNNMVLVVAGNFEIDTVLEVADRILKPAQDVSIEAKVPDEPRTVNQPRVEMKLPVAMPMFNIGFKEITGSKRENAMNQVLDEILIEILAGEASPLYRRMYDSALINSTFGSEVFAGRDYIATLFSGESRDPDKVYDEICTEIERVQREGIDPAAFDRCRKAIYGRYIRMLNNVEGVASALMQSHFCEFNVYELIDLIADCTLNQLTKRLNDNFSREHSAISIIHPAE